MESAVTLDEEMHNINFGVVSNKTMSVPVLLDRDTLKLFGYKLTKNPAYDRAVANKIHNLQIVNCNQMY